MGSVMRNLNGTILGSMAAFQENVLSSIDAEGLAIFEAMRWAGSLSLEEFTFEIDCVEIFYLIQGYGCWSPAVRSWVAECAELLIRNHS